MFQQKGPVTIMTIKEKIESAIVKYYKHHGIEHHVPPVTKVEKIDWKPIKYHAGIDEFSSRISSIYHNGDAMEILFKKAGNYYEVKSVVYTDFLEEAAIDVLEFDYGIHESDIIEDIVYVAIREAR
jgi:hypothetical protein